MVPIIILDMCGTRCSAPYVAMSKPAIELLSPAIDTWPQPAPASLCQHTSFAARGQILEFATALRILNQTFFAGETNGSRGTHEGKVKHE